MDGESKRKRSSEKSPSEKLTPIKKGIKKSSVNESKKITDDLKEFILSFDIDYDRIDSFKVLENIPTKEKRVIFVNNILNDNEFIDTHYIYIDKMYKLMTIFINDDKKFWKKYINENIDNFQLLIIGIFLIRKNYGNIIKIDIDINIIYPFIKILNYKSIYTILSSFINNYKNHNNYEFTYTSMKLLLILQAIQNNGFLRKYDKDIELYNEYKTQIPEDFEILNIETEIDNINKIILILEGNIENIYEVFYKNYSVKKTTPANWDETLKNKKLKNKKLLKKSLKNHINSYIRNEFSKYQVTKLKEILEFNRLLKISDKLWKKELEKGEEKWVQDHILLYNTNKLVNYRKVLFYEKYKNRVQNDPINKIGTLTHIKDVLYLFIIEGQTNKKVKLIERLKILIKLIKKYYIIYKFYNPPETPNNQLGYEDYSINITINKQNFNKKKDIKYMATKSQSSKSTSLGIDSLLKNVDLNQS